MNLTQKSYESGYSMNTSKQILTTVLLVSIVLVCQESILAQNADYPDPDANPRSSLMLSGDWFKESHDIDFEDLPKIPSEHVVVKNAQDGPNDKVYGFSGQKISGGVTNHCNLAFFDGRLWLMWSDGPGVEDRVGQVVKYATSKDGLDWSDPKFLTPYPPDSEPDSPYYNTRSDKGFRWIARGFWNREGEFLALASLDEAAGFFGPSLGLRAFRWETNSESWADIGLVHDNAINNFPPKRLSTGEWMMSRRAHDYAETGVDFLIGGRKSINQWESFDVPGSSEVLDSEEPYWWILPDGESLMALYRDNRASGYLYRSFSTDNGRTWSRPVQTNFPDARSKFHGLRLSDGRYVLVSNPNPEKRDPLALSISDDGMVFTKMGYLIGGRHVDYPHVIEHNGYLYVAYGGSLKQKVEVLKIKVSDLDNLDMSKMKAN